MHFRPDEIENFKLLFENTKLHIASFEGCEGVKLLEEAGNPETYFTLSTWQSEQHLEGYRSSKLFEATWSKTKAMFAGKPMAWSMKEV